MFAVRVLAGMLARPVQTQSPGPSGAAGGTRYPLVIVVGHEHPEVKLSYRHDLMAASTSSGGGISPMSTDVSRTTLTRRTGR